MIIFLEECEDNEKNIKITLINHSDLKIKLIKIFNFLIPKVIPKIIKDLDKGY